MCVCVSVCVLQLAEPVPTVWPEALAEGLANVISEGRSPRTSCFQFPRHRGPGAGRPDRRSAPGPGPGGRGGHRFSGPQVEEEQVEDLMVLVWRGPEVTARCPPRRTGAQTWVGSPPASRFGYYSALRYFWGYLVDKKFPGF